jgi:hypothetical protein
MVLDRVAGPFFPQESRRFLTMGTLGVVVLALATVNVLFFRFLPTAPPPVALVAMMRLVRSAAFLVPFDAAMLAVLAFVFASNPRTEFAYLRALLFAMVLAALVGELVMVLVPIG